MLFVLLRTGWLTIKTFISTIHKKIVYIHINFSHNQILAIHGLGIIFLG